MKIKDTSFLMDFYQLYQGPAGTLFLGSLFCWILSWKEWLHFWGTLPSERGRAGGQPTRLVELEGLVSRVDGHRDGPHRGHGLHQRVLLAARHVHEARVVGRVEFGVIVARLVVLPPQHTHTDAPHHQKWFCISRSSSLGFFQNPNQQVWVGEKKKKTQKKGLFF